MKRLLLGFELFLAGGLFALLLVRALLLNQLDVLVSAVAQAEVLNLLDKLLTYYAVYGLALIVVGLATAAAWVWPKPSASQ